MIPLNPLERAFCTCEVNGAVYVFLRAAQGSRGAPGLWARIKACAARCVQSMDHDLRLRCNTYVDDPILATRGGAQDHRRVVARTVLTWMAMGFGLAWPKGQHGPRVTWTSAVLHVSPHGVVATFKR